MKPGNTTEGSIEVVVTKVTTGSKSREKRKGQKKAAIFWGWSWLLKITVGPAPV